jgi:hypothetical protein
MPQKLQLKLLSNSGELLSVVSCLAGKISVLRASVPSDLRPYQRTLGGSPGKENLLAVVDGADYRADEHTVIGFGEPSPTTGRTVKEFLTSCDIPDGAIEALLLSIGLETVAEKKCSELTPDQEARLRLLAATADPEKIVVLNDPFENISGQWRERAADILATFARTRKAIIVIPSLSYRPESWIDNQCIERLEVGQTSQRTIGFGSAGSAHNAYINELRDRLRQDAEAAAAGGVAAAQTQTTESRAAATLSAAALATPMSLETGNGEYVSSGSRIASLIKAGGLIAGAGIGVWVAVTVMNRSPATAPTPPQPAAKVAMVTEPSKQAPHVPAVAPKQIENKPAAPEHQPATNNNTGSMRPAAEPAEQFVLDRYPAPIRVSLVETTKGIGEFKAGPSQAPVISPPTRGGQNTGNLFSLLEKASDSKAAPARAAAPMENDSYSEPAEPEGAYQEPGEVTDEEARREAIRNRFLDAIRSAAEKRQASGDE